MKVIVSGASGLIGSELIPELERAGHSVARLVRREANNPDEIRWDPAAGELDPQQLTGADAVIHLAGENIAGGRWTADRKRRIRDSRIQGTSLLSQTLASLAEKPATLICASAIGIYGDRGDQVCDERTDPGEGYLPKVCQQWEAATEPAARAGIRVVNLRIGIVLSTEGGALAEMLRPFRFGVGGIVGNGRQFWSWITLADLIRVIMFALDEEALYGPVNAVAPQPVTNREFTKCLGQALRRPTIVPLPAIAARLLLGEMADALLLASAQVVPQQLLDAGFNFSDDELLPALRTIL